MGASYRAKLKKAYSVQYHATFTALLAVYLHIFYGYWLEYERDRQYINQRLIPSIESIPTLFSFPDAISRLLTGSIFYGLVPLVLVIITVKAWALTTMGLPLTYVSGVVTIQRFPVTS